MVIVRIEEYHNDNNFKYFKKEFTSFKELKSWILSQMGVCDLKKWIRFSSDLGYFTIQPNGPGWSYHIHQIEDDDGIIFSDGQHTCGQTHVANCIKQWMYEFKEELNKPKFNFINK